MYTLFSKSYKNNPTMKRWRVGIPLSIFLFFACLSAQAQCACTDCRCSDSLELVKLYNATNGANWTNKWILTQPMTSWYGITLTNGRVIIISLFSNQLSGTIPNFNLPNLQGLNLDGNQLSGNIPNFNLPNLQYLNLNGNQLSGNIPNFNLPNLQYLNLDGNQLSGNIPNFNLPNLQRLYIDSNQLNGNIPNFNLPKLELLYLSSNQLGGSIPNFNLPNLQHLLLNSNQLSGNIPIFNLPNLRILYLDTNKLNGCIPREIKMNCPLIGTIRGKTNENPNLATQSWANYWNNGEGACTLQDTTTCRYKDSTALAALYRATNMQNAPPQYKWNLSQPITTWYGVTLNQNGCVKCLDLDGGPVNCDTFDLNPTGIGLVGTLPDSIRLLTSLERMQLQGNTGLGGVLPPNFGSLSSLKSFYAYNCRFTAPFPPSFWQLPNIDDIDLNDNPLNIPFPAEFGNFRKLKGLHLCTTGLTGTIPQSIGTLDSLGNLDICDNQLTGSVPNNLISRTRLQVLQIESNKFDVLPKFDVSQFRSFFQFWTPFFSVQDNRFTFDDILPNMPIINRISATYGRQDSIFQTITYTKNVGEILTIDLGIDAGLSSNKYVWIKNGVRFDSSNQNTFILRGVTSCDAGTYKCEVTNPNAPLLTLRSRIITLIVNPSNPQTRNKTICYGQKDTLPSGQIVAPSTSTTYPEIIRNRTNTCDSVTITTNLTVTPLQTISKTDSFCQGGSYMLPQTNRVVTIAGVYTDTATTTNGCKTRYATTLTYRKAITQTINATICKGESYRLPDNTSVSTEGSYTSRKTSATNCDTIITTILTVRPSIEAFDDEMTINIGDSATINLLTNDKLSSFGGRFTVIKSPIDGTWRRLTDSIIRYKAPQILRGLTQQILEYKVCMNGCLNNCDTATLRITLKDLDAALGRIKNGVATEITGDEYFEIDSLVAYPQAQLFIYNNWNELVFKSTIPYDNRWSGTDQRESPLPSGVYYYVLRHAAPNRKLLDGKILLLR